jgi:hypothetical protein
MGSVQVDDFKAELAALSRKQAHVSFGVLGVVVLTLALMAVGGYVAMGFFERALEKQDAKYSVFVENQKAMQEQLRQDAQTIANLSVQQGQKVVVIHDRDQKADRQMADVTSPNKPVEQVARDFGAQFGYEPGMTAGMFQFTAPQVQGFTALKIDRDRLYADYADQKDVLGLEQQKNSLLTNDVAMLTKTNKEANEQIQGYKKLAHRSKFQKFTSGAWKVGLFGAGVYLGSRIH